MYKPVYMKNHIFLYYFSENEPKFPIPSVECFCCSTGVPLPAHFAGSISRHFPRRILEMWRQAVRDTLSPALLAVQIAFCTIVNLLVLWDNRTDRMTIADLDREPTRRKHISWHLVSVFNSRFSFMYILIWPSGIAYSRPTVALPDISLKTSDRGHFKAEGKKSARKKTLEKGKHA